MLDVAKFVDEYGKYISIIEISIDIEMFYIRERGRLRGYKFLSKPVRPGTGIIFIIGFKFF
ncbi:MAG: hypothetical protein ACLTBS_08185 [Eisenbergiella sp.]